MKTLLTHSELREERIRSNEEKKDPESAALILLPNNLLRGEEGSGVARFLEENVDITIYIKYVNVVCCAYCV